jgi:LysR family transcriptional regulator (chromosome initiation inhibitor)
MQPLNSSQLAAFVEIVRTGSFEGAAKRLHVTPSAISQRVKQLEDSLGQILIVRQSPCRATKAGNELLRHATQVMLLEEELAGRMGIEDGRSSQPITLSVAVNADSLDGWFVGAVRETCTNLRILLDIRVEDQDHSAQLLRDGEVMAAVSTAANAPQGCTANYLGRMRYLALSSPAFCAQHFGSGVDVHSLAAAPTLVYNAKDNMQQAYIELIAGRRLDTPSHFIPSTNSFVQLAKLGLGWGMIPEHMADAALASGELKELVPGRSLDIELYFHRWQIRSSALDALASAVQGAARGKLRK